jgi:tetratricopeptide (TPR) repeat protein
MHRRFLMTAGLSMALYAQGVAAKPNLEPCDELWNAFVQQTYGHQLDFKRLASEWKTQEVKCNSSDSYYYRLGEIYLGDKNLEEAQRIASKLTPGSKERRHLELQVSFTKEEEIAAAQGRKPNFPADIVEYEKLVHDFPNWYIGYLVLARLYGYVGTLQRMRDSASVSIGLAPSVQGYSLLVMADYEMHQYEQTISVAKSGLGLEPRLEGDPSIMLRLAAAYYNLGRKSEASATLDRLLAAGPGIGTDENYLRLRQAINQQK